MIRTVFLSFLLIAGCATNEVPRQIDNAYFDELFNMEYFRTSLNPFQDMHQTISSLSAESENPTKFKNTFSSWYWDRHGQFMPEKIHYRNEEAALFITFDIDEGEKANANLSLHDDVLHITGQLILKTRRFERKVRLDQKLPVPSGLDPLSAVAWSGGNKYTIRIEKLES